MEKGMAARTRQVFELQHPNAAGIDIGSASHFVAVPPDRDDRPVREFKSFTEDLLAIADWLSACEVDCAAMESTGVYWIPLYELLVSRGFTVFLVNARHVKNVSGRKSDVLDCQWLQQLMSFGLLAGAFRPEEDICALRALSRLRDMLIEGQASHIQHQQKALTEMNVQLTNVLTDVDGKTGQAIIRAIVAGERDPTKLAELRDGRVHASREEIAKSLRGNWREEHLFSLAQALKLRDAYQERIDECDRMVEQKLLALARHDGEAPAQGKRKGRAKNAPNFDARTALFRVCGVDLTRIDGIDVGTAMKIIAEIGPDLSKFKSVKHFCSWLGLCPGTKISGGKRLSGTAKRCANRVMQALKVSAMGLLRSKSALGAYCRRMAARMDKPKALKATAHKLARLVYTILTKGEEYVDRGQDYYEQLYRQRVVTNLQRRANELGFTLTPNLQTA
jgi:transposase